MIFKEVRLCSEPGCNRPAAYCRMRGLGHEWGCVEHAKSWRVGPDAIDMREATDMLGEEEE